MKYIVFLIAIPLATLGQQTVGLQSISQGISEGYVLFSPTSYTSTYLIDNCGREINNWNSTYTPGQATYLKENGNLVRSGKTVNSYFNSGGKGGIIEEYDWDGNLVWTFQHSNAQFCMHHDIELLPNGNILAISWERINLTVIEGLGRNPATYANTFWSEKIIEIEPIYPSGGNIVWEWHAIDHTIQDFDSTKANFGIVAEHPENFDINYYGTNSNFTDWIHFNSIDYNDSLDLILLSSRFMCEVYVIDHSTSTAEAQSHGGGTYGSGGDILYRWGNPQAYKRGGNADKRFFEQHSARWVPYGYPNETAIVVFNNGVGRPNGLYSSVEMILPPGTYGFFPVGINQPALPDSISWTYMDTTTYFLQASSVSSVQPLQNGNFLILDGPSGRIVEVDSLKNILWAYISPVGNAGPVSQGSTPVLNVIFRVDKYLPDFPGFSGHDMTAGDPVELSPLPYLCDVTFLPGISNDPEIKAFPVPATDFIYLPCNCANGSCKVLISGISGKTIIAKSHDNVDSPIRINTAALQQGLYFYRVISNRETSSGTFIISR